MRKVALVFVVAVFVPSLVLAWLAVRSLQDQQFLLERQQSLLYQRVTDALAGNINARLLQDQQEFSAVTESLFASNNAAAASVGQAVRQAPAIYTTAGWFDRELKQRWPLAEVGFGVTLAGQITCPQPGAGVAAQQFLLDNSAFLGNREAAEVYWNVNNNGTVGQANSGNANYGNAGQNPGSNQKQLAQISQVQNIVPQYNAAQNDPPPNNALPNSQAVAPGAAPNYLATKAQARTVNPKSVAAQNFGGNLVQQADDNLSKIVPAEAEFRQLIGDQTDGMLARFLQNQLKLMFWHRLNQDPNLIFGAELNLGRLMDTMRDLVQAEPALRDEICLVLLDDKAKPVMRSRPDFRAAWKQPLVATEIGEALPHWEVAAYLVDPAQLTRAACTAELTLGLLIGVLVLAIGVGSLLIVSSLNAELKLARQKTDFVSNVSHELKTPLTSIRMFSELLAEGRVRDPAKQQSYLHIITAEAARLTRLINNVLDFARLESGEKRYHFQPCDLADVVRGAVQTFRPHLEANGFRFEAEPLVGALPVRGDADALSQVLVNLLSNAEKYAGERKEITLEAERRPGILPQPGSLPPPPPSAGGPERRSPTGFGPAQGLSRSETGAPGPGHAAVRVLDRGTGVPRGSGEKIFEKFYRAHDSLGSGIQGSGLGLTIARQIARAHGGDVTYEPRPGGGSIFTLRLPLTEGTP
jgi:signal transduction histidine kinase